MAKNEFILCAAIHFENGAISNVRNIDSGIIVCGRRHKDCYTALIGLGYKIEPDRKLQGFLTSKNRYIDRLEAFKIAKSNNQIIHKMFDDRDDVELNSEDLYYDEFD